MTDPAGRPTRTFFDALGRTTFVAENWHDFDASDLTGTGDATDKSRDRVTRFVYNGLDQLALLVALDMNADGDLDDNQETLYLYEDPVAANRVTREIYPDLSDTTSSGTDQVKLAYALDGRQTARRACASHGAESTPVVSVAYRAAARPAPV